MLVKLWNAHSFSQGPTIIVFLFDTLMDRSVKTPPANPKQRT